MKTTRQSKDEYNKLHANHGFEEEIEYYKVLGALLKGKKSIDIGCGYGFVSLFSPETLGVDFSEEALEGARQKGVRNVVLASADKLPFADNEFEISLSNGVLEHIGDIKKAISEMIRVSEIQIYIVHARLPYGLEYIRRPVLKLFGHKDQPIESPQSMKYLKKTIINNGARVIVEGIWNYIDLRWLHRKIPYGLVQWPSHHFVISIKTTNLDREFLGKQRIK